MDKHVKIVTQWDNPKNEDYVFAGDKYAFVLDGSSGLKNFNISSGQSDARWLTHTLGKRLAEALASDETIGKILHREIECLRQEYIASLKSVGLHLDELESSGTPSAAITVMRWQRGMMEFYQLGDCTAIFKWRDGRQSVFFDTRISALDNIAIEQLTETSRKNNISCKEGLPLIRETLIAHRCKKNKPDGYWILDLSGDGINHGDTAEYPLDQIESIAIMSDGFADMVTTVPIYQGYDQLLDAMEREDLGDMVAKLYNMLEADETLTKYPRFKLMDDSSAVWKMLQ